MQFSFRIKKDIDTTFDYLTDMQKFITVHPIISKMKQIDHETFLMYETLTIAFIPFSFTYPVTVQKNSAARKANIKATVFKQIKIEMNFTLTAENEYTIIEEEIKLKTLVPIQWIVKGIFKKHHARLFKNIESI
ncbi:MAG: hypothetical protein EAZ55_09255 [Cytophagales bacterium]|nr:MAG: hypothetical protein EAZ55_09255 [Cytophagales bacterium]